MKNFYNSENSNYKVMSFNIRYDNINDNLNRWINRKEPVSNLILSYSCDLIGLQEVF